MSMDVDAQAQCNMHVRCQVDALGNTKILTEEHMGEL